MRFTKFSKRNKRKFWPKTSYFTRRKTDRKKQFITVSIVGPEICIVKEFNGELPSKINSFLMAFKPVSTGAKISITKNV